MTTVEEAIIAKMTWRSEVANRYARALLERAVDLFIRGVHHFNNDDVREAHQPNDKTTVGAVIKLLLVAKVIEPTHVHLPDQGIVYGRRASTREGCNGHKNQLYRLTNTGIALEWLRRHGGAPAPQQQELFSMPTQANAVAAGL